MSAADPRSALRAYAQPLQAALHCVTPATLVHRVTMPEAVGVLRFRQPSGVELRRRDPSGSSTLQSVYLLVYNHITVLRSDERGSREYQVFPEGYSYVINDRNGAEVLAYHWHPGQRSHEHDPHLHIGSAVIDTNSGDFGKTFSRLHIPTGQMALARVVRMLITEFQVVPNRQDWEAVLASGA